VPGPRVPLPGDFVARKNGAPPMSSPARRRPGVILPDDHRSSFM
jgi:hypothetical protein